MRRPPPSLPPVICRCTAHNHVVGTRRESVYSTPRYGWFLSVRLLFCQWVVVVALENKQKSSKIENIFCRPKEKWNDITSPASNCMQNSVFVPSATIATAFWSHPCLPLFPALERALFRWKGLKSHTLTHVPSSSFPAAPIHQTARMPLSTAPTWSAV